MASGKSTTKACQHKKAEIKTEIEVNATELAEYFGVSVRRISQMVTEGIAIKTRKGRYDLKASVQKYISFIKDRDNLKDSDIKDIEKATAIEKLFHERAKKRKTELLVGQMENKLHRAEDVEEMWNSIAVAIKTRLLAIPIKTSPVILGMDNVNEIQAIIKREVSDALDEVSNYDPAKFETEYSAEDDSDE